MTAIAFGRGRLTPDDHTRITELAEKGMKPGRIAQLIKRHQSTVYWFMISRGLVAPRPSPERGTSYIRNGKACYRFSAAEDAFVQALRVQQFNLVDIARMASKRFGTSRTRHGIEVRLIMLGAREDAA